MFFFNLRFLFASSGLGPFFALWLEHSMSIWIWEKLIFWENESTELAAEVDCFCWFQSLKGEIKFHFNQSSLSFEVSLGHCCPDCSRTLPLSGWNENKGFLLAENNCGCEEDPQVSAGVSQCHHLQPKQLQVVPFGVIHKRGKTVFCYFHISLWKLPAKNVENLPTQKEWKVMPLLLSVYLFSAWNNWNYIIFLSTRTRNSPLPK